MSTDKKRTPLFDWHVRHGANMVEFGDYVMPVWYSSAKDEHMAVVRQAGLFDTSHMAAVRVFGPGAFDLLQWCFTRNLDSCVGKDNAPITPGKCVYGAFLDAHGHAVDDSIVYKVADEEYLVVVNAGMGGVIAAHLEANRKNLDVRLVDLTDQLGKIDIQGPASIRIMQKVLAAPDAAFDKLTYFSFKGHFDPASTFAGDARLEDGTPLLLSRSGYTGEVGFEIFVERQHNAPVWNLLMEAGKEHGLMACGLAARDSLRTGAVLPLSHQDIGHWVFTRHPWPFALPLNAAGGFTKSFLGSAAIERATDAPYTVTFVGHDLRKIDTHTAVVRDGQGRDLGTVLTCATDMAIGRGSDGKIYSVATPNKPEGLKIGGLACGFIKVAEHLAPGTVVELKDVRRSITVTIETDVRPDRTARKALKSFMAA